MNEAPKMHFSMLFTFKRGTAMNLDIEFCDRTTIKLLATDGKVFKKAFFSNESLINDI